MRGLATASRSTHQASAGEENGDDGRPTAEKFLTFLLRATAFGLFVAAVLYAIGPLWGPWPELKEFFKQPPFVSNSVVKVTILGLACLYAAGDVRTRRGLISIVIVAHLISVAAMASMLLFANVEGPADLGFWSTTVKSVLLVSICLDALITAAIAGAFAAAWRATGGLKPSEETPELEGPSQGESVLRIVLVVFTVLFAVGAAAYELAPFIHSTKDFAVELPFVTNSVVKVAALAMICAYAASNLERNMQLVGTVITVLVLSAAVQLLYLWQLDPLGTVEVFDSSVETGDILRGGIVFDSLLPALILWVAYRQAWRSRYRLRFLWPSQFRTVIALSETLVEGSEEAVTPAAIAKRVESFLEDFRASRRWLYKVALTALQSSPLIELTPLPRVNPPLSELDPQSRKRFLIDHFERRPQQPGFRIVKHMKQVMIRIGQQLCYAGYYGDPASYESIGYKPFSERTLYAKLKQEGKIPEIGHHPLEVHSPGEVGAETLETEVCIVGSGAGGGILAYELAKRGHQVLVLERGEYRQPQHFNESEIEMMSHLYSDGLMQQSEDWRFTVLQGSCVGGSTTVNNGVCFRTPDPVLERWNDPSLHDAGIDVSELKASTAAIESFLSVVRQTEPDPNARLNPSGQPFADAAAVAAPKFDVNVVNANIKDCLGSGYCNMGCKWGRKLSMLETALPWAQQQFPGRVKIVAECEVKRIMTLSGKPNRVAGLVARLGDGRVVQVKADKYILAAGAIASSYLMLRSNVGGGLPVGEGFCCNMGAPLTADLGKKIDSYDGLQISHYGGPQDGYVFETWFNPPVAQALNMPGWFDQHFANMRSYDQLMAVGVLVGTRSNGRVGRALTGGPGIHFRPHPEDRQTMARGMKQLAKILFAMNPKPERVMVNTWGRHDEYTSQSAFNRAIDAICDDPDYMNYGTGHPQGGNALSRNPKRGVVDSDFRVHGYQDLYVCDASVFPTSLTVNPQLTVMSLAHYAAPRIGC